MLDSTNFLVASTPPRMGRPRINAPEGDKMTSRFPEGTLERMEAVLRDGEPKSSLVRDAVLAEIERREKAAK